jgi:8-amino-7-oxononanoate synthase
MAFGFNSKKRKPALERIAGDKITKLRLKYKPYYHTFENQKGSHVWLDGQELIMLASNDYLGLGEHPKVIEAGKEALEKWGSSSTGARLANGSRAYHTELEEELAAFLGKESCHIHSAGYLSCVSSIQAFAQRGDFVFVDKNVHSSLWSGVHLSGAKYEKFIHNDPVSLKKEISYESPKSTKFVVVEGVYSMEGHICRLPEIVEVTEEEGCFLILDDAHGLGVVGENGEGTPRHFGVQDKVDIVCGSFSKALSSTGGYVAGSREVMDYFRTHSKQTIFSAALSPSATACALASLRILKTEPEHHQRLESNRKRYLSILKDLNLNTWDSETPAIPIVLGEKEKVYRFWKVLMEQGVFTVMSIAPAVPPGKDLIRTSISARHTDEDLDKIAEAMSIAVKKAL